MGKLKKAIHSIGTELGLADPTMPSSPLRTPGAKMPEQQADTVPQQSEQERPRHIGEFGDSRRPSYANQRKDIEMSNPKDDAKGQFAPSQAYRKATGVASAKPTVVTGSEDATIHRDPPGKKSGKDFDLNYDPAEKDKSAPGG